MLLEVEDEVRDFTTTYKKDFPSKKTGRPKEYRPQAEYPPPLNNLNGPYRKCLNTQRQNAALTLNEQTEDSQQALNRVNKQRYLLLTISIWAIPRNKYFSITMLHYNFNVARRGVKVHRVDFQSTL